jgi:hypothetical protein
MKGCAQPALFSGPLHSFECDQWLHHCPVKQNQILQPVVCHKSRNEQNETIKVKSYMWSTGLWFSLSRKVYLHGCTRLQLHLPVPSTHIGDFTICTEIPGIMLAAPTCHRLNRSYKCASHPGVKWTNGGRKEALHEPKEESASARELHPLLNAANTIWRNEQYPWWQKFHFHQKLKSTLSCHGMEIEAVRQS